MKKNISKYVWILFPIFNNLISLITIKIISTVTTFQEFGEFSLVKSIIMFIGPMITLGIPQAIIRFLPKEIEEKKYFINRIIKFSKIVFLILVIIFSIVLCVFRLPLRLEFINISLIFVISLYLYLQNCGQVINSIDRAELNLKRYNLYTFYINIISTVIFIAIYIKFGTIVGYYIAFCFTYIIVNRYYAKKYLSKRNGLEEGHYSINVKEVLVYGIPLIMINISGVILSVGDRFILNSLLSSQDVGIYSGLYSVANGIWSIIFMIISSYVNPIYINMYKNNKYEDIKTFLKDVNNLLVNISIGAIFFLYVFNELIIKLFLNDRYIIDVNLFASLFIGNVLYGIYYLSSSEYYLTKRTFVLMKGMVLAGIINIIINIVLVPHLGISAAAISTIISYVVLILITSIKQSLFKLNLNLREFSFNIISLLLLYLVISILNNYGIIGFIISLISYIFVFILIHRKLLTRNIKYIK